VNEADVLYSPDAMREMTSRRVISGSTMARVRAAISIITDEILHTLGSA